MSKIARIYQGTNEIQKYYQGGVLQRLFFDWKHYIGNELNIEYAKECAGRNVMISGKTYQNLFKAELSQDHVYGSVMSQNKRVNSDGFTLDSTTYTICVPSGYEVLVYKNFESSSSVYIGWANKLVWTNSATTNNIRIMIRRADDGELTVDEAIGKVILLKGDYTNIDLPNNIDGIESVGEREFVKSKNLCPYLEENSLNNTGVEIELSGDLRSPYIYLSSGTYVTSNNGSFRPTNVCIYDLNKEFTKISKSVNSFTLENNGYVRLFGAANNRDKFQLEEGTTPTSYEPFYEYYPVTIRNYNYKCETDNIVLPNGVKNSIDTIDGKKVHTRRVGAVLLNGTQDMELANVNQTLTTRVRIQMDNAKVSKNNLICNWFIRTGAHGDYEYIIIQDSSAGICLFISVLNTKLSAPTVDGVKQYFNENPLWVFYELATPIYTHLESGLYDDITIPTSNIKNEIYLENGKWYHKRNIGKVVFDGSDDEAWGYSENPKRFSSQYIKNAKYKNVRTPIYADGYTFSELTGDNFDKLAFLYGNSIYIYNYDYTTVDDFKAYLAENPLEVYYELAEPIISELYFTDLTYKLNEPIRSLTDKIYDYIKEGKIVRKIGKYTFTNKNYFSSPFGNGNPNNGTKLFETTIIPPKTSKIICDKFNYVGWGDISNTSKIAIARFSNSGNLIFRHNSTSLQEFQNYLLENPVTVYYELATPTETEITPDMILINGEPITDTVDIELPDGTCDSIENDYYVKRVGKVIIDGKKGKYQRSNLASTSTLNVYAVRRLGINITLKGMNTNYIYQCDSEIDMSKYITVGKWINDSTSGSVVFKVPTEEYLWSDIYNAFLENPITLYVELATPVKIPLFSIKEGLTTLKSTNNITPQIELDCLVRDDFQNMCDNEWEVGDIVYGTGEIDDTNSSRIRLINYIKVKPNTKYRMDILNSVKTLNEGYIGARYYDNEKSYLGGGSIGAISKSSIVFTTPENCYYIRFIAETTDVNFKIYLKEVIE